MKEEILKLRADGKTYNEIQRLLGCSKGTISYHCGADQKQKHIKRTQGYRKNNAVYAISSRVYSFHRKKVKGEQRKRHKINFSWQDVIEKFGWETTCYLTGRPINLKESETYHFDHIVPTAKGGSMNLENLGITCKDGNLAKSDMSIETLIGLCKEILTHNGYEVKKL